MILARHYPDTFDGLIDLIRAQVSPSSSIVVQAGHFLVYYDHTEDQLLPCVASELRGPRQEVISSDLGYFPLLSWEIGLALLAAIPTHNTHILVLVNDWQYLPKDVNRERFYKCYRELPRPYRDALAKAGQSISLVAPPRVRKGLHTGPFFSEQTLRNRYGKHVKEILARNTLPTDAVVEGSADTLTCSLVDVVGRREEIYCAGKTYHCTHEVAELLYETEQLTGCDVFVNLFPLVCKEYVEAGTELSFSLFHTRIRTVINLGMRASGVRTIDDLLTSCNAVIHSCRDGDLYGE